MVRSAVQGRFILSRKQPLPAPRAWVRRLCGQILFYGSAAAVACLLALIIVTIFGWPH
jgi:hypothetical protein